MASDQQQQPGPRCLPGDQPPPIPNDKPDIQSAVIADMRARRELGIAKYGTPLQPGNGRKALLDAYEEALDMACYLKQELVERGEVDVGAAAHERWQALREGVPLGHSISAHTLLGWCSHCPGRALAEEAAAWQVWAYTRLIDDPSFVPDRPSAATCGKTIPGKTHLHTCAVKGPHHEHACECGANWWPIERPGDSPGSTDA